MEAVMRLTLKKKIISGFLGLNVLMALSGIISILQLSSLGSKIQRASLESAQRLEVAEGIVQEIAMVRYYGNRFLDIGSPDDREETRKRLTALADKTMAAQTVLTSVADYERLTALGTLIAAYREKFDMAGERFAERAEKQMLLLQKEEEIEATLMNFFNLHRESLEASRPFLFFVTAKQHLTSYFNTFGDQDFLETVRSLETVERLLLNGAGLWGEAEAAQWKKAATQVKEFHASLAQLDTGTQELRQEIRDTLFPLPDKMLAQAQAIATTQGMRELTTNILRDTAQGRWFIVVSLLVMVGVGLTLGVVLSSRFTTPLAQVVRMLQDVAEGEGDLTKRLELHSRDEVGELARWFNTFMDKLHAIVDQVQTVSHHVATAAQQLSAATTQLSGGAQQQAASLEETVASLEEITSTVRQNADSVRQVNELAAGSCHAAEKGGQVVTAAVEAMGEINKASQKIADIITTIDEIAFQTNLLALNAAVEAARAGEQGRGFAVVAAEVRNLAQRSATAAKEIRALIQDSVQKVHDGAELVHRSGQTLEEIVTSVKRVSDLVAEMAAAHHEQLSGIEQVNKVVAQVDHVTQANAAQTEELSATAQALATQAQQLQALVGRFKLSADSGMAVEAATAPSPAELWTRPSVRKQEAPSVAVGSAADAQGTRANGESDMEGFREF
jgi:methyl-accepting chemotaxis protein